MRRFDQIDTPDAPDGLVDDFSHCFTGESRVNVLPILFRINKVIAENADLATLLSITLDGMRAQMRMRRGAITVHDRHSDATFV